MLRSAKTYVSAAAGISPVQGSDTARLAGELDRAFDFVANVALNDGRHGDNALAQQEGGSKGSEDGELHGE